MLLAKRTEMDMTTGPLMKKLALFAVPLVLTGILQLLFNAADIVVVGHFAGRTALAAVGSTTALTNLIVNVFMMISIGVSVAVSQHYGAHEFDEVGRTVSTAMYASAVIGVFVGIFGIVMAKALLAAMGSPDDVLDQAALYMRIYFAGIPAFMVYNFGAAALRAVGDTQRPLQFLTVAGVLNVILNLITVVWLGMGVAGVAIATAVSQYVSAAFVVLSLIKTESCIHIEIKELCIHKDKLLEIVRVGAPAGLQSAVYSISNVLIQSSINSFGSAVMAGSAAAGNIEGFIYVSMNAVVQAAMAFTGQNIGAKKYGRISEILWKCIVLELIVGGGTCAISYIFSGALIGIYSPDPEVIAWGVKRLSIVGSTYYIMGVLDVVVGMMRGMGKSTLPMCISIFGICVFRVIWLYTLFAANPTFNMLLLNYPASWVLTLAAQVICYTFVKRSVVKGLMLDEKLA